VDIAAGWEALEHGIWVNGWRKRTVAMEHHPGNVDRFRPATKPDELATVLEASLAVVTAQKAATTAVEAPSPVDGESGADPAPVVDGYQAELRAWLQGRIDAIGATSPEARADLATAWPEAMPALRTSTDHTPTDLANIEHVLDQVERHHRVTFPDPRPGGDDVALVLRMFPHADAVGTDQKEATTP
jgi:hypothetical protein